MGSASWILCLMPVIVVTHLATGVIYYLQLRRMAFAMLLRTWTFMVVQYLLLLAAVLVLGAIGYSTTGLADTLPSLASGIAFCIVLYVLGAAFFSTLLALKFRMTPSAALHSEPPEVRTALLKRLKKFHQMFSVLFPLLGVSKADVEESLRAV